MNNHLITIINKPKPGTYVVAVSGGVDSIALLCLLVDQAKEWGLDLYVAHFNHGWSEAGDEFEAVARRVATDLNLPYHTEKQQVPRNEAAARTARYDFLRRAKDGVGASAIITAHHAGDVVETMVLNLLRGTGRRGLSPFQNSDDILRPLVRTTKAELTEYARSHNLEWIEDPSNSDTDLRRNYVRAQLIPEIEREVPEFQSRMLRIAKHAGRMNRVINEILMKGIEKEGNQVAINATIISRSRVFVVQELLVQAANLLKPGIELNKRAVEEMAVGLKTGRLKRRTHLTSFLWVELVHGRVIIVFDA